MAIFGVGAYYDEDVSGDFIKGNLVGVGWGDQQAPELHRFVRSLKVGDIVYIKAYPPGGAIYVKAIGLIKDDVIRKKANTDGLVSIGRNVHWITTDEFQIPRPNEKNNVRANTMYEEYHPEVQQVIMAKLKRAFRPTRPNRRRGSQSRPPKEHHERRLRLGRRLSRTAQHLPPNVRSGLRQYPEVDVDSSHQTTKREESPSQSAGADGRRTRPHVLWWRSAGIW